MRRRRARPTHAFHKRSRSLVDDDAGARRARARVIGVSHLAVRIDLTPLESRGRRGCAESRFCSLAGLCRRRGRIGLAWRALIRSGRPLAALTKPSYFISWPACEAGGRRKTPLAPPPRTRLLRKALPSTRAAAAAGVARAREAPADILVACRRTPLAAEWRRHAAAGEEARAFVVACPSILSSGVRRAEGARSRATREHVLRGAARVTDDVLIAAVEQTRNGSRRDRGDPSTRRQLRRRRVHGRVGHVGRHRSELARRTGRHAHQRRARAYGCGFACALVARARSRRAPRVDIYVAAAASRLGLTAAEVATRERPRPPTEVARRARLGVEPGDAQPREADSAGATTTTIASPGRETSPVADGTGSPTATGRAWRSWLTLRRLARRGVPLASG